MSTLERMGSFYNSSIKRQKKKKNKKQKAIIIPHKKHHAFGHMLKIKAAMNSTKSFKSYL